MVCVVARVPQRLLDATGIGGWVLSLAVVVATVTGARAVARAPFSFRRAPSPGAWVANELKAFVATTVLGGALTLPLYALLRATDMWWLLAALLFAAVTVIGQVAMPFGVRLQSGPLTDAPPPLAELVEEVATRAGVDVAAVSVSGGRGRGRGGSSRRTTAGCNAYVVGLGPTRRIVLDGSLPEWPEPLVAQVVAHEIGHWRLGHARRRLPLAVAAQTATLALAALVLAATPLLCWAGAAAAGDPRSLPLLLLLTPALALPARCLLAWRDRSQERAADDFALNLLGAPADFSHMLERAADEGGAARTLPWWRRVVASHPPIDERMHACTQYASIG
jgi:STE24 endopeptidase